MQDNVANVMALQVLREIGTELRAIREELGRLSERLEETRSAPPAPSTAPTGKFPRLAPR